MSHVVFAQHGASRVSSQYLCAMEGAVELAGLSSRVSVISPHFLDSTDCSPCVDAKGHPLLTWDGDDPDGVWR